MPSDDTIAVLREQLAGTALNEADVAPNPIEQFRRWFDQAQQAQVHEPTAATLATADAQGIPSARIVLVKQVDARGFAFFTNYQSRKAKELAENPSAALVYWWKELHRQVRVRGRVERTSEADSETYFQSRPRGSQLGAISPQSQVIESRDALEAMIQRHATQYAGQEVPRPDYWGGFRLTPSVLEFWQHRPDRLHDRIRYRHNETGDWIIERLAP